MSGGTIPGLLLAGGRARRMALATNQDKCLLMLAGRTLLDRVIERAAPQVGRLVLNANGDPTRFSAFGLPVVADGVWGDHGGKQEPQSADSAVLADRSVEREPLGPLAGVLAGLEWTAEQVPTAEYMASFATDTPFLPGDLVAKLALRIERGAELACARAVDSGGEAAIGLNHGSGGSPRVQRSRRPAVAPDAASINAGQAGRLQPLFALWPVGLRHELRRALVKEGVRKVDRWMARYRLAVVDFPADATHSFFNINRPADLNSAEALLRAARAASPTES